MVRAAVAHLAVGVLLAVAMPTLAHAGDDGDYFARLAAAARTELDAAAATHAPKLVPPVPVKITWKAIRLGSLDLGAPLIALTAADLDGDGRGELYAVTSHEVIAIGIVNQRVKELGRVAFAGELAVPASRDVVGSAIVDGGQVVAASSMWERELRVGWNGKALVASAGSPGFLLCPGERAMLAPGRNHFGDPVAPVFAVRCRTDLVDVRGAPLHVRAVLTGTRLAVTLEPGATPGTTFEYKDDGVAFAIADVDHDGRPEVIVSGAGAPGDPDAIKVITVGGDDRKPLFRRQFTGGVAGITVVDSDGDGVGEVIAAVRLFGATRVDLWRLD